MILVYYGMSDVFDNLVILLCKFIIFFSFVEVSKENLIVIFFILSSFYDFFYIFN